MPMGKYKDFADCVAQNADKADPKAYCSTIMRSIEGMSETDWFEVFKAGDYGDKGTYSETDLEDIVSSFYQAGHIPPVIIGHHEDEDIRKNELTDGHVIALKRDGDKLLARANVTPEHAKLWQDNKLLTWSVGLYKQMKDTGKVALRHLAALGKTPPEVKGLKYKPVFTFSADAENGDYYTIDMEDTMSKELTDRIAELERENASLKAEQAAVVKFSEEKKALTDQAKTEKARADKTEADLAALKSEQAAKEKTATFAEIEKLVAAKHEEGYPATTDEAWKTVFAAERGMTQTDGSVCFSEDGKTMKFSEAIEIISKAKIVPVKPEGDHVKKPGTTTVQFSELTPEEKVLKAHELASAKWAELKKTNPDATILDATSLVFAENPGLE